MEKSIRNIGWLFFLLAMASSIISSWYWLFVMGRDFFDLGLSDTYTIMYGFALLFWGIVLGIIIASGKKPKEEDDEIEK